MTAAQFTELFRPFIRVQLDWETVRRAEWPVSAQVVTSTTELNDWYFPWYIRADGREGTTDADEAHPIPIREWPVDGYSAHREAVDKQLTLLRALTPPVQLLLATYSLPGLGHLVLDGNHRIAAAVEGNLSFVALAITLRGPIEPSVLPDLRHWQQP